MNRMFIREIRWQLGELTLVFEELDNKTQHMVRIGRDESIQLARVLEAITTLD